MKNEIEDLLSPEKQAEFLALFEEGEHTLIQRISLLVEQERTLRAEKDRVDSDLRELLRIKHELYIQLDEKNSD